LLTDVITVSPSLHAAPIIANPFGRSIPLVFTSIKGQLQRQDEVSANLKMSNEKRKSRPPYPPEFEQQIVELVASGRTAAELSRELGASAQSIGEWVKKADAVSSLARGAVILAAHRQALAVANKTALMADERSELERLRKQNKRLQIERDILAEATA
jgi:transposase